MCRVVTYVAILIDFMCTRPLKYWRTNLPDEEGCYKGFITGYDVKSVNAKDFKAHGIDCTSSFVLLDTLTHRASLDVPCGHCQECHADKARIWTFRLLAEAEYHLYTYFITLTYDDDHFPLDGRVHIEEAQHFIRNFRRLHGQCRYFIVGEYGDLSNRPHYHCILFTSKPISDLHIHTTSSKMPVYTSVLTSKAWNDKGNILIGLANGKTMAYTCGYIQKKTKKQGFYLMSKKPGIGSRYFEEHYIKDDLYLGNGFGKSLRIKMPKYFKDKYGLKGFITDEVKSAKLANKLFQNGYDFDLKSLEDFRDFVESIESQPINYKV